MEDSESLRAIEEERQARQKAARAPPPVRVQVRTRAEVKKLVEAETQKEKRPQKDKRKKPKEKRRRELRNALFAGAGTARRIAFAIDISGSMGGERIEVVKQHMALVIGSMEGQEGCAFGISLFDTEQEFTPLGPALLEATPRNIAWGLREVARINARGGNGGEVACLRSCLRMYPDAIFFLGDGGWEAEPLVQLATQAATGGRRLDGSHVPCIPIHSIAFFTTGGGLPEIASLTGGTYREVNSMDEIAPRGRRLGGAEDQRSESEEAEEDDDEGEGGREQSGA